MAKLYAELTSDKGGRVASKGGKNLIRIVIKEGNREVMQVWYEGEKHQLEVHSPVDGVTFVQ